MKRLLLVLALALLPAQSVLAKLCEYDFLARPVNVASALAQDADIRAECCSGLQSGSLPDTDSTHCTACSASPAAAPCMAGVGIAFESPPGLPAYQPRHYDPGLADRIERVPLIVS